MITIDDVIPKLKLAKKSGDGYTGLCPAHSDKKRSLSVNQRGDKLLLFCHAGCAFQSILDAFGFPKTHNTPPPQRRMPSVPVQRKTLKYLGRMWSEWRGSTDHELLEDFAYDLHVSPFSLDQIGCCWAWPYDAWGFPMFDADGEFTGMRLRGQDGSKRSVSGGREGLFMSDEFYDPFLIVEGPTDLAALLTLGFNGIGRPNCRGAVGDTVKYCRKHGVHPVVIADNDNPGIAGARELCKALNAPLAVLPAKDMREFIKNGGTKDMVMTCINSAK